MATNKQTESNRANAKKSTGPRTEEGKSRVSQNPDRFYTFARRFYVELQPKGPTERSLLDMMITARWRLMRLSMLETAAVDQQYELLRTPANSGASIPVRANMAYCTLLEKSRSLDALSRMEARLQHQFDSAFDRLNRLLAARRAETKPVEKDA